MDNGHIAVDNVIQLEVAIRNAMNSAEITIAVLVDFELAFDPVCKNLICQIIKEMDFPHGVIKFFLNYLPDKIYKVWAQSKLSRMSASHIGLSQVRFTS